MSGPLRAAVDGNFNQNRTWDFNRTPSTSSTTTSSIVQFLALLPVWPFAWAVMNGGNLDA
jgi:hypothetical protein